MKKMFLWLVVAVVCVAVVSSFGLVGCKEEAAPAEEAAEETTEEAPVEETVEEEKAPVEEVVIRIADWQAGVQNILDSYNEFIKIFEEKHPGVKVEYTQYSYTTYNEFLKPSLAGGTAPDIFAIYPGSDVVEVANSGNIINLTAVLDEDPEWRGWLGKAEFFLGGRSDDKLWIAPQDAQTECIWIHKDMLEACGVEVPPMEQAFTVDQFIELVEAAKENGYDVISAGHMDSYSITGAYFNMVHQLEPSDEDMLLKALDGEISWQQDMFRLPIEAYKKMHDAGVWSADSISKDYQVQAWGDWLEKKAIGIWCNGDWFAGSCPPEENNSDNPNIGIFQYPLVNEDATPSYNWGFGTDLAIYSKGENQDLAMEFVKFTNSPEAADIFVKNYVNPAASGAIDMDTFEETDNPIFNDCIKMFTYKEGKASTYFYPHADPQRVLFDGIVNVMIGQDTIDNVLANLDEVCGYEG